MVLSEQRSAVFTMLKKKLLQWDQNNRSISLSVGIIASLNCHHVHILVVDSHWTLADWRSTKSAFSMFKDSDMVTHNPTVLTKSNSAECWCRNSGCKILNDLNTTKEQQEFLSDNRLPDQTQTWSKQCSHISLLDCGKGPFKLCMFHRPKCMACS